MSRPLFRTARNRLSRAIAVCLVAAAAVLPLTASSPAGAADLRLAMGADVTSIDPHYANLNPNSSIAEHIFDKLVELDVDGRPVAALAESWRRIDDNTWEFKLRRGVRFHDGSEFTAEDAAFSVERPPLVKNSPAPFSTYVRSIAGREVVDSHTLRLRTTVPNPALINDLCMVAMLSKKAAQGASSDDFNQGKAAVGTGPYRLVSYKRGDRIELARNDAYWRAKSPWDKVTYRLIPNDPTRLAALLSGDVQAIDNVPTTDVARLRTSPDYAVFEKPSSRLIFLYLDQLRDRPPFLFDKAGKPLEKNPFKDRRVRLAISKAINRDALRDTLMSGAALPAGQMVPAGIFGHNPALKPEPYDPEGAKKLLAEAGWPNGFAVTLHGPNNRYVNDDQILQAVASMLARVGIAVKVEAMPINVYLGRAQKGEFTFGMLGFSAATGEASGNVRYVLATYDEKKGTGQLNRQYSNPKMDETIDRAVATLDDRARERLIQEATAIAMQDVALVPLHWQVSIWAVKRGLRLEPRTDEHTWAHRVTP